MGIAVSAVVIHVFGCHGRRGLFRARFPVDPRSSGGERGGRAGPAACSSFFSVDPRFGVWVWVGVWLRIGGRIGLEPASRAGATRGWRGTHRDLGGIGHGGAGEVPFGSLRLDRDTRGQRRREEVEVGARIFMRGADSMCDAPGLAARVSPPRSNRDDGTIERRRGPRGRDESPVDDAAVEMGPRSRTRPHVAASHAAPPRRSLPKALVNLQGKE